MGRRPEAVPDEVDVNWGGREDGTHVVAEIDEVGGALEFLRGRERFRWEFRVDHVL